MSKLFDNTDADLVWSSASDVIRLINPDYDFTLLRSVYKDVMRMFYGEYPGYGPIKTLYHDLSHTLEVFLCGVRLMHGVHLSGEELTDDEITLMLLAILMHDIGYAQRKGEECGTGAQFTLTHVQRGIEFMRRYFMERKVSPEITAAATSIILGTEHSRPFDQISFKNNRARLLGCLVATADITGQMADRKYLEKLLFLYQEFKEAQFGGYRNLYDLLCQTHKFYEVTRKKLDVPLGGVYRHLSLHFRETVGEDRNLYMESIEKNMAYLSKILESGEQSLFAMLKRNGISKNRSLAFD